MSEPHKVTDSELVDRLRELVRRCDLRTTTASAVRRRLEEDLAVDLYGRRAFITQQIDIFLRNDYQEEAEEVNGNEGNRAVVEGKKARIRTQEMKMRLALARDRITGET